VKIGFIGGGNMATALIGGLAGKLTEGKNIHVVDLNPESLTATSSCWRSSRSRCAK
jgi:pyrroline-5-carboxylate reductase